VWSTRIGRSEAWIRLPFSLSPGPVKPRRQTPPYLPISSTGHLIITQNLLGLADDPETKRAVDAFNIVIQGGAILAVLGLYFPRVDSMCRGLIGRDPRGQRLAINILVAFLPAAVLGVLLNDWIEARLFNTPMVLTALALGGVFMIAIDRFKFDAHGNKPDRDAQGAHGK